MEVTRRGKTKEAKGRIFVPALRMAKSACFSRSFAPVCMRGSCLRVRVIPHGPIRGRLSGPTSLEIAESEVVPRGRRAFDEECETLTCVPSCLDDVNARPLLIANDNAIALAA